MGPVMCLRPWFWFSDSERKQAVITFRTVRNAGLGILILILAVVGLVPTLIIITVSEHEAQLFKEMEELKEVFSLNESLRDALSSFDESIRISETDFSPLIRQLENVIESTQGLEKNLQQTMEDKEELEKVKELIREIRLFKLAIHHYSREVAHDPTSDTASQLEKLVHENKKKTSMIFFNFLNDTQKELKIVHSKIYRIIKAGQKGSLAGLAAGIIAGLLVAFFMGRFLARPIERLVQGTERVSQGDLDFKIEVLGRDEFSRLATSFNGMTRQLKAFVEEERRIKQELESLVGLRTRELVISEQQKKRLHEQQELQKAYSKVLSLMNSIDVGQILGQSLKYIVESAGMQWGGFYLANTEAKAISLQNSFCQNGWNPCPEPWEKRVQQNAEIFVHQVFQDQGARSAEWTLPGPSQENIRVAANGYLLKFQEKHLGMLVLAGNKEPGAYAQLFVENIVRQLGIAIHNALTFKDLRHKSVELKESNLALEQSSQAKSDFLANMSHELRTPLNHIIGFSELLVDQHLGKLNEIQTEYLNDVLSSGRHLLSLINDILDISKMEAGKMELDLSCVKLDQLFLASMSMVKAKAIKHGIQLTIQTEAVPETIWADERKLKQVMFNLLSNAVKFTPDQGKIHVRAEIIDSQWVKNNVPALFKKDLELILEKNNGPYLKVSVADNGIGISPLSLIKVFGAFQQEGVYLTKKYEGTGLGLALCKKFLELHKGGIWVESQRGKGSTFFFVIPSTAPLGDSKGSPGETDHGQI